MTALAPAEQAQQSIDVLRRHLAAINAWDFAAIRANLHPDISYELPFAPAPFPRVTQGLEAVMVFSESIPAFAESENLHDITIRAYADDPCELVAEYRSDMKLTNGRPYRNTYVVRATVKDGKLFRFCEYFDPIELVVAMGGTITIPETTDEVAE
jgi:ketosteroid isomerase-like protein